MSATNGLGNRGSHNLNNGGLMEQIVSRENMSKAYKRVVSNKGALGIAGMMLEDLSDCLNEHWISIKTQLLAGDYYPKGIRQLEIQKPNGGVRKLGIRTVIPRLIE